MSEGRVDPSLGNLPRRCYVSSGFGSTESYLNGLESLLSGELTAEGLQENLDQADRAFDGMFEARGEIDRVLGEFAEEEWSKAKVDGVISLAFLAIGGGAATLSRRILMSSRYGRMLYPHMFGPITRAMQRDWAVYERAMRNLPKEMAIASTAAIAADFVGREVIPDEKQRQMEALFEEVYAAADREAVDGRPPSALLNLDFDTGNDRHDRAMKVAALRIWDERLNKEAGNIVNGRRSIVRLRVDLDRLDEPNGRRVLLRRLSRMRGRFQRECVNESP